MQRSSQASLFLGPYTVVEGGKICAMCVLGFHGSEEGIGAPEAGEWMVGSHNVRAGNRARVLSKSYKCS